MKYKLRTYDLRSKTNEQIEEAITQETYTDYTDWRVKETHLHQEEFTLVVLFEPTPDAP